MAKDKKLQGNIFDAFHKLKEDFGIDKNNTEKAIQWSNKMTQPLSEKFFVIIQEQIEET